MHKILNHLPHHYGKNTEIVITFESFKMETQNNKPATKLGMSRGFFTKISVAEEAEKPIKSISRLCLILGIINIIGGVTVIVLSFVDSEALPKAILIGIASLIFGLIMSISAIQFKKYRTNLAALWLLIVSSLGLLASLITTNIIALILYSIASFSGIDAIRILKQLEKLKTEES
jgi:uncharacterized membrane protein HdeD (DUF308 family)